MEDINIIIKDEEIPVPGIGTYLLSGTECVNTIENALSIGYRLIDTAQNYENESEVGLGIKRTNVPRDDIFLITKIAPENFKFEDVGKSTQTSLKKIDTDYIDLLLIHWPSGEVPLEETTGAMKELQKKGYTRHIGVSNFPPSLLNEALEHVDIFANEVEYHPYLVREYLKKHAEVNDYLTIGYSPLAQNRVIEDTILREIGNNYGKTPAQVALRWLVQQGIAPIPKASQYEHLEENMEIFDFNLTNDEMLTINALDRGLHLDPVSDMANEE
jgi:diketogulonate reductase-like aldo/keto reductase